MWAWKPSVPSAARAGVKARQWSFTAAQSVGQPVTTTFADYLLPSAMEVPTIETLYKETPSPLNPLGAKGAGEVSTIPTAAAVISAIEDALQPFGVRIAQTPVTPHKLVELIANGVKS